MSEESKRLRSFVDVWVRRAITISGCVLIWLLLLGAFPLLLIAGAIIDLARGGVAQKAASRVQSRWTWIITRCVLFFPFYFTCEVLGIIASFVIWLVSGVWLGASRVRFLDWNFALQRWWAGALCRGAQRLFRIQIEVEGADELRDGPVIVFLRHASVADTLLPAVFIANPNGLKLRYVLKHELLLDPCLDIVGNRLPNSFVRRNTGDGFRVIELMADLGPRDGVIIYPEGTRFTDAKRAGIIEQLDRKGDSFLNASARMLKNVLPLRLGGALNLLDCNLNADVVFCAHFGFDGVVDLRDFLRGSLVGRVVKVRFWRLPFASIPKTRDARTKWLFENWMRVDEWVGRQKANESLAGLRMGG
ncbi:MAG TPA: 1-acyl-sn-glycerol-3-phosphate acyltransferase [Blastocatellia bacterium]|nr:1-acyl-sn-glycerol-3-phosphate acyltransferase [Blastocatellia bacterium]